MYGFYKCRQSLSWELFAAQEFFDMSACSNKDSCLCVLSWSKVLLRKSQYLKQES